MVDALTLLRCQVGHSFRPLVQRVHAIGNHPWMDRRHSHRRYGAEVTRDMDLSWDHRMGWIGHLVEHSSQVEVGLSCLEADPFQVPCRLVEDHNSCLVVARIRL